MARKPAARKPINPSGSRSKRKRAVSSLITLPECVTDNISRWKGEPGKFLYEPENDEVNWETPPVVLFYQLLIRFDHGRELDLIRSRFLKVIFHDLKKRFCVKRLHSHSVEIIAQIISASGLINGRLEMISSHLGDWCKDGETLDAVYRDIYGGINKDHGHLGILFCLPGGNES